MDERFINQELKVQIPAIAWLKKNWGYQELRSAEDDQAWGAPIDSVGLMQGRTFLIEFKTSVSGGDFTHSVSSSSSIEKKIARTLAGVYGNRNDYNFSVIRTNWECAAPLVFVLLAASFTSRGLEETESKLRLRGSEWKFDYRIWQWDGYEVREVASGRDLQQPLTREDYAGVRIPHLVGRSDRLSPPPQTQHRQEAARKNILHIFDHMVSRAKELGYRISTTGSGLTLLAKGPARKRVGSISLFVTESSAENGMLCRLPPAREDQLPGAPAPRVGPYLEAYRFIRTIDEAEVALTMLAPSP
jgi:hypothetical protein